MLSFKSLRLRHALLVSVSVLGGVVATIEFTPPAYAQEVTRQYSIEPQDLNLALREFATQTGRDVLYPPEIVAGKRSPGAHGQLTERDALDALLAGTGLRFEQTPSNGFVVQDPNFPTELDTAERAVSSDVRIEEIVVTGTHIRGRGPIGSTVTTFDREAIEASGRSTVQDILQLATQNFSPNISEFQGGPGNFSRGSAVNLRGLGAGATLTLINGHRQSASGDNGDFVDVSSIPVSAIERIEILADGASAIYGSDAIGGVVNIVLRDEFDGAETSARVSTAEGDAEEIVLSQLLGTDFANGNILAGYQYYRREPLFAEDRAFSASPDKRPFGGTDQRLYYSNPGVILDPFFIPAYSIPAGQDGTSLTVGDLIPGQVNFSDHEGVALLPDVDTHSAFVATQYDLSPSVHLSFDGRYSDRSMEMSLAPVQIELPVPPTNPFYVDPFGTGDIVFVGYSFIDDLGPEIRTADIQTWSTTGAIAFDLTSTWSLTASGSYGSETTRARYRTLDIDALFFALFDSDPATAFNPFGDGSNTNPATLDSLRFVFANDSESSIASLNMIAEGVLASLPAGDARLAIGADYRQEELDSSRGLPNTDLSREVSAAFAELAIPLLGREGAPLLEASLAGRYESYSDFGDTFNPRVGLSATPADWLTLRATWGTSFRAPNLIDLDTTVSGGAPAVSLLNLPDPASSTGFTRTLFRTGNNANLQEETAKAWTAGFDIAVPDGGPRLSVTYFDIVYEDRIGTPGPLPAFFILTEADQWQDFINLTPSAGDIASLCTQVVVGSCAATPPTAIVDVRKSNFAALSTRGVDFTISQLFELGEAELTLRLNGTYVDEYARQPSRTSPTFDVVSTVGSPLELRLRATAALAFEHLDLFAAVNYQDDYRSSLSSTGRKIDSWTTLDLGASVRPFESVELSARVVNAFNEDPPFHDVPLGFDGSNATPIGRVISLELTKRW